MGPVICNLTVTWNVLDVGEAGAIRAWMESLPDRASPSTITISKRVYLMLARYTMPKRSYRRLRGRLKGERRLLIARGRTIES